MVRIDTEQGERVCWAKDINYGATAMENKQRGRQQKERVRRRQMMCCGVCNILKL